MIAWSYWLTLLALASELGWPKPEPLSQSAIKRPPPEVKAVYATASTAASPRINDIIQLIDQTEINAVVVNVKEPSGEKFWPGLGDLVQRLKNEGIWTIARVVVFQNNDWPARDTGSALKYPGGALWRDRAGGYWLDPAAREVWQYNAVVSKRALAIGFDEINLDYIRFPSDGDVDNIAYPYWDNQVPREKVIADFATYIVGEIKNYRPHAVVSADIFAFTLVQDWDLGIGQRARVLADEFDVIAPMIYPSHYRAGNFGLTNPAEHPYQVVADTLKSGRQILGNSQAVIRPWLQDFDLGARYTAAMVRQQFKAVTDSGYNQGWMLWNAKNIYTAAALLSD